MLTYDLMYPYDIFNLDMVNIDYLTENYTPGYYFHYLLHFSTETFCVRDKDIIVGYLIGRSDEKEGRTGHITALSVSEPFRYFGLGSRLMEYAEEVEINRKCSYIDLYVRKSNERAIEFYFKRNYIVDKIETDYYTNPVEDAYDMRKYFKINEYKKNKKH